MNNYDEIKKLYDNSIIYNNEFDNYDDDFSFWIYWINKIKPKKVLEIGIGNGRLIKLLSNLVSSYDALEISKNIIDDFNLNNTWYKVKIFHQDMKKININDTYDLIILPFNTFCYLYTLDDLKHFFSGIKRISNNDTIIVIDIINPGFNDLEDIKTYCFCNTFSINNDECKLYEKHHYDSKSQTIHYFKKYIFPNNKFLTFNLPVRIFFHQELLNLLDLLGFKIVNIFGDYNNEEYNSSSRKQILFIKRSDE